MTEEAGAAREAGERLRLALAIAQMGTWDLDLETGLIATSTMMQQILDWPPEGAPATFAGFLALVHPQERPEVQRAVRACIEDGTEYHLEHRVIRPDGRVRWIDSRAHVMKDASALPRRLIGVATDITRRKRVETLHATDTRVLEMLASGTPMEEALLMLIAVMEDLIPGALGSILVLDEAGRTFERALAPHLPRPFEEAVVGMAVDSAVGSFGQAAYRGRRAITEDIAADPAWHRHRELAESLRLRACWAQPVLGDGARPLGIVSVYLGEPRRPEADDLALLESMAHVAGVAIEGRRKDEALRRSETSYRSLTEHSPVGVWQTGPGGQSIYANPAVAELLELDDVSELYGTTFHRFFTPEGIAIIEREVSKRAHGVTSTYEVEVVGKRGRRRHVVISGAPLPSPDGSSSSQVGTLVDVTDLKAAEEALGRQTRMLEAILDSMADGVIVVDEHGKFLVFNPAARRITGLGPLPVAPEAWTMAYGLFRSDGTTPLPPEEMPLLLAMKGQASDLPELHVKNAARPAGVDVSMSARPLQDGAGALRGGVAVLQDITQRRRAEAALRDSERHLQEAQKMEAVGRLAGSMAHDFNNLLTAIAGYADLLAAQTRDAPRARADVEEIQRATGRAAELTRQLLAFSRKQVAQPTVLDLRAVVSKMERLLRRVAGEHIRLELAMAPDLGPVKADAGQMEQVIMNLAANSRDAMPDGGTLTIALDDVEGADGGRAVRLEVRDTGCGMDAAVRARLFEPFFTTKGPHMGTGLGLSAVYGIVSASGGTIDVWSEVGAGTRVTVLLPRAEEAPAPESAAPASAERPRGTETVLLAEDEAMVRALAARILTAQGYRVLAAASGAEALEMAAAHQGPIHLLLTDVMMPGMNGVELAQQLLAARPGTRVLFMSGYTGELLPNARRRPPGAFLAKPFPPADLVALVRAVLDGAHDVPAPE